MVSHPLLAAVARIRRQQGRRIEAITLFQRALPLQAEAGGELELAVGGIHEAVGMLRKELGMLSDAAESFSQAVRVARAAFGSKHAAVGVALRLQGEALAWQGRWDEALTLFEEAHAIHTATLDESHVDRATTAALLGGACVQLERGASAVALLEGALPVMEAHLGSMHLDVGSTLVQCGRALAKHARFDEAMARYVRARGIYSLRALPKDDVRVVSLDEHIRNLQQVLAAHDVSRINTGESLTITPRTAPLTLAGRIAHQRMERSATRKRTKQHAPTASQAGSLIKAALEYEGIAADSPSYERAMQTYGAHPGGACGPMPLATSQPASGTLPDRRTVLAGVFGDDP